MILTAAVDAHVNEAAPATNYGTRARLTINGGGGSNDKYAYVFFPRQVPPNAKVLEATLRVYLHGAWSGTNDLTCKRITGPWKEGTLNWNNKPAVVTTNQATRQIVAGVDKQLAEFDVTAMMQDVANGSAFFGFRIELTQNVDRTLRSAETVDATAVPTLELEWSEAPDAPDRLSPDGADAVSVQKPVFDWRFTDKVGTGAGSLQASSQVQISSDIGEFATTPDFDSGKIANVESQYDSSTGAFAGINDGETKYWRVRVWDGTDKESDWSAIAEFKRDNLGTLSLSSPGATVGETTPPVTWSLTGETQSKYKVTLFEVLATGDLVQLWTVSDVGAANTVTIEHGYIVTGKTFRVRVEVWDTKARVGDEHKTSEQTFTYVRDGTPADVLTLTAVADPFSNAVVLTWTRAAQPDFFALRVDGIEVLDRIEPADVFVSGTTYSMQYWLAKPRVSHTFEVEAVVQSSPGQPYLHSNANPVRSATPLPVGNWLVDAEDGRAVQLTGKGGLDWRVGESGATFFPVGAQVPVRVTDKVRGYEGNVSGELLGPTERDDFNELKRRSRRRNLYLIIGDLVFPIRMEEAVALPTAIPGDDLYAASFAFFQAGPPWPVGA